MTALLAAIFRPDPPPEEVAAARCRPSIPASRALFCHDCANLSLADAELSCAQCGSRATTWINAWLNRPADGGAAS